MVDVDVVAKPNEHVGTITGQRIKERQAAGITCASPKSDAANFAPAGKIRFGSSCSRPNDDRGFGFKATQQQDQTEEVKRAHGNSEVEANGQSELNADGFARLFSRLEVGELSYRGNNLIVKFRVDASNHFDVPDAAVALHDEPDDDRSGNFLFPHLPRVRDPAHDEVGDGICGAVHGVRFIRFCRASAPNRHFLREFERGVVGNRIRLGRSDREEGGRE